MGILPLCLCVVWRLCVQCVYVSDFFYICGYSSFTFLGGVMVVGTAFLNLWVILSLRVKCYYIRG